MEESSTINSLKIFNSDDIKLKIDIVNNGPLPIKGNDFGFSYNLIQHTENRSLSNIYNDFIERNADSEYYIIFDQDTIINHDYKDLVKSLNGSDFDIYVPKVIVNKNMIYPIGNIAENRFRTIASGLIINKKTCDYFKHKFNNVFDERFVFYGVDSTFFMRLKEFRKSIKVSCSGSICHSLSRLENNDSPFRVKERSYDFGLTNRHYMTPLQLLKFVYFLFSAPLHVGKYKNLKISYVFKAFFSGKHYKNTL